MPKNLQKFVNPKFIKSVPLILLRRLLELHRDELIGVELALFDGDAETARVFLTDYPMGPEERCPPSLIADLHRIAELGTRQGLDLLLRRARSMNIDLSREEIRDPKHLALLVFLDHPELFDAAASVIAFYEATGVAEIVGREIGADAQFDAASIAAFVNIARKLFETELRGDYCNVQCYDDSGDGTLVVTHGEPMSATPIIEERAERVITFRGTQHAYVSYSSINARLKVNGIAKARRSELAEAFARCFLDRPGFFQGPAAQRLYTLAPIEREWPQFKLRKDFDPAIRSARIVEAQVDERTLDLFDEPDEIVGSLVARDAETCALARLARLNTDVEFTSGVWKLGQIVIRPKVADGGRRDASVTVRIRPAAEAVFKRQRFESQIMNFLRRNGFCLVQDADRPALAAE